MSTTRAFSQCPIRLGLPACLLFIAAASPCADNTAPLYLTGASEIPPVTSSATGTVQIMVQPDRTVSGSVTTSGIVSTVAHIHEAPVGKNGPPIVTLKKTADDRFVVPDGAKLTDAQYTSYLTGKLYVNVHSEQHPDGEIRAPLLPLEPPKQ